MQGMPKNLLTPSVASPTAKVDSQSTAMVNGKPVSNVNSKVQTSSEGTAQTPSEAKGAFASLFSSLIGEDAALAEANNASGNVVKGEMAMAAKAPTQNPENKLDVLMSEKNQDISKKTEVQVLTPEQALSPEVLKNIDALLNKSQVPVDQKIAATSTNLDQLLQSLRGDKSEVQIESEVKAEGTEEKAKAGSPLDFLLKQSKASDVGSVATPATKDVTLLETNPEGISKLGLSSEDFISQLSAKESGPKIGIKNPDMMNLDNSIFDGKELLQKQMNQSIKSYGQKQDLLSGNIIRGPKDLASRDSKSKVNADELRSPDMKIGAELAGLKESLIPVVNKQEQNQQTTTQGSEKVLDLSKMNTSNTNEIIKKISDYIAQEKVGNSDNLDLTVKHDSLGQFKIQVNRPAGTNQPMDMQITTTTSEGHDFFMKNEIGLMKNLSQAGIQLSDFRIVSDGGSASFAGNDSRQNNSQNGSQLAGKEFMSFEASGDSSHGADRRKELWQQARNNQQRYGA